MLGCCVRAARFFSTIIHVSSPESTANKCFANNDRAQNTRNGYRWPRRRKKRNAYVARTQTTSTAATTTILRGTRWLQDATSGGYIDKFACARCTQYTNVNSYLEEADDAVVVRRHKSSGKYPTISRDLPQGRRPPPRLPYVAVIALALHRQQQQQQRRHMYRAQGIW